MSKIEVDNLHLVTDANSDAGNVYRFHCPDCEYLVTVATRQWWIATCKCDDKIWKLKIYAEVM